MKKRQPEVAPCHKLAANLPGSSHLHQTNSEVLPLGSCSDLLNLAGLLQETNQCYFQIKSNNQKIKIKQNKTKKKQKNKTKKLNKTKLKKNKKIHINRIDIPHELMGKIYITYINSVISPPKVRLHS